MEKEGLRRSLNYLLGQDVSIDTIATNRHRGVVALMKKEYPYITHQYDVWHMAKSVVKQLTQKGKLKHCERLLAIFDHNYNTNRKQATTKQGMLILY